MKNDHSSLPGCIIATCLLLSTSCSKTEGLFSGEGTDGETLSAVPERCGGTRVTFTDTSEVKSYVWDNGDIVKACSADNPALLAKFKVAAVDSINGVARLTRLTGKDEGSLGEYSTYKDVLMYAAYPSTIGGTDTQIDGDGNATFNFDGKSFCMVGTKAENSTRISFKNAFNIFYFRFKDANASITLTADHIIAGSVPVGRDGIATAAAANSSLVLTSDMLVTLDSLKYYRVIVPAYNEGIKFRLKNGDGEFDGGSITKVYFRDCGSGNGFNSNCYVIQSEPDGFVEYTFNCCEGRTEDVPGTTDGVAGATSGKVLWMDTKGLITQDPTYSASRMTVRINPGMTGNALVALQNPAGETAWSWHLWVVDDSSFVNRAVPESFTCSGGPYNEDGSVQTTDQIISSMFMDRNIGAMSAVPHFTIHPFIDFPIVFKLSAGSRNKVYTPGYQMRNLYYQWGRKDPFVGSTSHYGGGFESMHDTEGNLVDRQTSGNMVSTEGSIRNPQIFNNAPSGNERWNSCSPSDFALLWGDDESFKRYNPCPVGWTLPDQHYFNGVLPDSKWNDSDFGRMFDALGWLPALGGIDAESGKMELVASRGYYWTRSILNDFSVCINFDSYESEITNHYPSRTEGLALRACRE